MKVFVITGGIGSGKTSACRFLEKEFGWPVYYADERVKALYMDSPGLLDKIETSLCGRFRDEDGRFVPSLLASVIFGNREALEKVEAIGLNGGWNDEFRAKYGLPPLRESEESHD